MATELHKRLGKLNPFNRGEAEDEEQGEEIDQSSVAGGGRSARKTAVTEHLNVSHALRSFLVHEHVFGEHEAGLSQPNSQPPPLKALIDKPHAIVPPELLDRTHNLSNYFISSSHNTYLLAHQLFGSSDPVAYKIALGTGARCVEIDAWDNEDDPEEPKVTHGYTLVSHIPFRAVCETIRDVVDAEATESTGVESDKPAPIMLSLENHCGAQGQQRLVAIMKEVWGDRLLSKAVRDEGKAEQEGDEDADITLDKLGAKIAVIVEYYFPTGQAVTETTAEDVNEDEEQEQARQAYERQKEATAEAASVIIPELASLGVYAQSVKPIDNSWFEEPLLRNAPHHHLINVSETGLASHLPEHGPKIAIHNSKHLMRVFPKGTRISSNNLNPVICWGVGAQIAALNWQTFGASMQLNEALFAGTDGYVLKPAALRSGGDGRLSTDRRKKLRLRIAGATDLPVPEDTEAAKMKPYVTCTLHHPDQFDEEPPKKKTSPYKQHKLGFLHKGENPPPSDPVWDEVLEWEYEDNDLTFLRLLIKDDVSFARNVKLAAAAVRLLYVVKGEWIVIRMLDLKGRETKSSLLVKFDIDD